MARYRKIDTRVWNDAKFNALPFKAKLVFFYLLSNPTLTMLGAMRATIPGMAAELSMPTEDFSECFRAIMAKSMAKHDEQACFVWLPNFLRYNKPESPNVVKSWPDAFDLLPECAMKAELFQQLKGCVEGLSKGFQEAFAEAFAKAMPYQEQEQEQEQEPEQEQERTAPLPPEEDGSPRPCQDAFSTAWNENRGDLPGVLELSDDRRKKLQTRIRGGLTIERFTEAVKLCAITPFLAGKNDRNWRADFDWLIGNDSNLLKVLEGSYAASNAPRPAAVPHPESNVDALPPRRDRVVPLDSIRKKAGIQ